MEKWVGALENGDYKQCYGRLRLRQSDGDKFCALGVAYETMTQDLGLEDWHTDFEHGAQLLDWLGFQNFTEITVQGDQWRRNIAVLNDDEKLTFPEIAQRLRKEYL